MQYLFDGDDKKIPNIKLFYKNKYKNYEIEDMDIERIQKICTYNGFGIKSSSN